MVKREIPNIEEDVGEIKYIGRYLKRALNDENIMTCEDLVDALEDFGNVNANPAEMRREVKWWLEEVLMNARSLECCFPGAMVIDGEACTYKARYANQRGFNALVKVMRHYAEQPWRQWVPRPYRGLNMRNKYPRECNVDLYFNL